MAENKSVFRQEMLDRLSSPEKLNDYIKVSNPGVFTVLITVVLLLISLCVWSFFMRIDTLIDVLVVSDGGVLTAYLPEEEIPHMNKSIFLRIDGKDFNVASLGERPVLAGDVLDKYQLHISGFSADDWVFPVLLEGSVASGNYPAKLIEESNSIISYLLN